MIAKFKQMRLVLFSFTVMFMAAAPPKGISIRTRDSLALRQGVYSSILFTAEPSRASDTSLPVQYRFTPSGGTPPGMKFENYPCNKPGMTVCPQLASANGLFLDGTPAEAGSYTFVLTAIAAGGGTAAQRFTVVVNPPEPSK